mmetsp:Transcript_24417/g.27332  ORF Transcript_24417/g.27332 Transcript_24417/m.27332 type:complete len:448 (-) Transcript_24417:72-1415(-)
MEIRTTEEKINELLSVYEGTRRSSILRPEQKALLLSPPPPAVTATEIQVVIPSSPNFSSANVTAVSIIAAATTTSTSNQMESATNDDSKNQQIIINDADSLIRSFRSAEMALTELRPRMDRFRKRLKEKDRITEKSRYGPKSQTRVQRFVDLNDFLRRQYFVSFSEDDNDNDNDNGMPLESNQPSEASLLFQELQRDYDTQQQEIDIKKSSIERARMEEEGEIERKIAVEEKTRQMLEQQRADKLAAEEIAKKQRLHHQAEETRLRHRAKEEAQKQAERNYLESIMKGPDGVKYYLEILLQQQQLKRGDSDKTLLSLCTIFEQINKHPEDVKFRKIRKNHPAFHQEIGQHEGGIELLIAAGFRPIALSVTSDTNVDASIINDNDNNDTGDNNNVDQEQQLSIACLVSKEPSLESDMDGWMAWFDLNKQTLEILQNELQKISSNKRHK